MSKARYVMIGGFLGAGKTTAILRLAGHLVAQGKSVGLITNDQSIDLVDTARARAAGHAVEEITGGCFCCKFDSLVEASKNLTEENAPDVLIAEPVGSCTDLKATVSYPLRQLYGEQYQIAPLSVLVDPKRCAGILGLDGGKKFTEKVVYVYRKQLEEAEIIVIHKADLLSEEARSRLRDAVAGEFPKAVVVIASSVTGEGVEPWYDRMLNVDLGTDPSMEIDYDIYAEGEALLGWLNARGLVKADHPFDGNDFLVDLTDRLRDGLNDKGVEIAHLKMTLAPSEGPDLAAVSLTRNDESPHATHDLDDPIQTGDLMVNLRAEADPEQLKEDVLACLEALSPQSFDLVQVAAFRPGRPTPTHRVEA